MTIPSLSQAREKLSDEDYARFVELYRSLKKPEMSLADFIPQAWKQVEPNVPYKSNWHIGVMAEYLTAVTFGQIKNLIINVPPRHMKSILVAVMWHPWVWHFRPWTQWLFFSHSQGFSLRDNVRSRRLIKSQWYEELFPDVIRLRDDQDTKGKYENDEGGFRSAMGVGSGTGDGGDFLVGDDLLNIADRHSKKKRKASNDFWSTTVKTRENSTDTAKVIICQRLHENDIVGHLEQQEEEGGEHYEKLIIPAQYEPARKTAVVPKLPWRDPREKHGDPLWPTRFDLPALKQLKKTLGSDAAGILQQSPAPATGDIFKKYWWKFWQPKGANLPPIKVLAPIFDEHGNETEDVEEFECEVVEIPERFDKMLQSWDMNFKQTKHGSFVCGQVWAGWQANNYLLDQERGRWDFMATIEALYRLTARNPEATLKLVEDKANGPAIMSALREKVPGLVAVNPMGDKLARANAVTPVIQSGNTFLPHPILFPWVRDYIDEHSTFPSSEENDQVDCTTQALSRMGQMWSR